MNNVKQNYLGSILSDAGNPTHPGRIDVIALRACLIARFSAPCALIARLAIMSRPFLDALEVLIFRGILAVLNLLSAQSFKEAASIVADIPDAMRGATATSRSSAARHSSLRAAGLSSTSVELRELPGYRRRDRGGVARSFRSARLPRMSLLLLALAQVAAVSAQNAYIADPAVGKLWVLDTTGRNPLTSIDILTPGTLGDVAVSPDAKRVYVTLGNNFPNDAIAVVDTVQSRLLRTVRTGWEPRGVAISPDGSR